MQSHCLGLLEMPLGVAVPQRHCPKQALGVEEEGSLLGVEEGSLPGVVTAGIQETQFVSDA